MELADQKFVPQFNVNDYIGNRRITYIPTYSEFNQKDYSPYGNILWENNNNPERLSFLSKEKDAESNLGDFGVRKYDDLTGRFTAIDPLWEKFYGWSPYMYSANNPVNAVDLDGRAKYYLNNATEVANDGNDDGLKYLTSQEHLNNSNNGGNTDFGALEFNSFLLPNKETFQQIEEKIVNNINFRTNMEEDSGVYGFDANNISEYTHGGMATFDNKTQRTNSGPYIEKALNESKAKGLIYNYFIHSHSDKLSQTPSGEDYNTSTRVGIGIYGGVMINTNNTFFFFRGNQNEIEIKKDKLKEIIND